MKILKKISIFFIVIAFIFSAFVFLKNDFEIGRDLPKFDDLEIENIKLDGKESPYSLKNGNVFRGSEELNPIFDKNERERVLRVALFYQQLKEQPLLFDPNLEVEKVDVALAKMTQANDAFSRKTGWDYANPIFFLRAFSETSKTWKDFKSDISEGNARKILAEMQKTQQSYKNEVERIGKYFKDAVSAGTAEGHVLFLGGSTKSNISIANEDFQKMSRNGDLQAGEIEKRKNCFENLQCERYLPGKSYERESFATELSEQLPEVLPFEDLVMSKESVKGGPFLIHSNCWKGRSVNLIYSAERCLQGAKDCLEWPFLSDGGYFSRLFVSETDKKIKENGAERRSQSETAPYVCLDLSYKPAVWTVSSFCGEFKNSRLFSEETEKYFAEIDGNELWRKGVEAEKAFFEDEYPSDSSLESLGKIYLSAYSLISIEDSGVFPKKEEFLDRSNKIRGKIYNFEGILSRMAYHFGGFAMRFNDIQAKNPPQYVFNIRSGYAVTFLNFSPFVWLSEEKPEYMEQVSKKERDEMINLSGFQNIPEISYQEALELFGGEKIMEWIRIIKETKASISE